MSADREELLRKELGKLKSIHVEEEEDIPEDLRKRERIESLTKEIEEEIPKARKWIVSEIDSKLDLTAVGKGVKVPLPEIIQLSDTIQHIEIELEKMRPQKDYKVHPLAADGSLYVERIK